MSQKQEKILKQTISQFPEINQGIDLTGPITNQSNFQQQITNTENMQMNIRPENQINMSKKGEIILVNVENLIYLKRLWNGIKKQNIQKYSRVALKNIVMGIIDHIQISQKILNPLNMKFFSIIFLVVLKKEKLLIYSK